MQIESQNFVLENPQFGTSSQSATGEAAVQPAVPDQVIDPSPQIPMVYVGIIIGILLIAVIWDLTRRKRQR